MMVLLPSNIKQFRYAVRENPGYWGWLITPRRSLAKSMCTLGVRFAVDNECYALGSNFDPNKYIKYLHRPSVIDQKGGCLFVTAPDVVANASATLGRFPKWEAIIHGIDLPVALVAQDGLEDMVIPWRDFECLFIGGTTEWKLGGAVRGLIAIAKQQGKWVHVGRVNSQKRLIYCIKLGVNSVDGTEWAINPSRGLSWATRVMEMLSRQQRLL